MPAPRRHDAHRATGAPTVAGWVSVTLGLLLLVRPASGTAVGLGNAARPVRAAGLADLAIGAGLLLAPDRCPWMVARMGGNVAITALCARTTLRREPHRPRALAIIALLALLTAQDARIARQGA